MELPTKRAIYTVRYAIATMPVIQRGYNFEQASYMRWAGREVLMRLNKYPQIPPLMVIESFRDECDSYSCLNPKTNNQEFIFTFSDKGNWRFETVESYMNGSKRR